MDKEQDFRTGMDELTECYENCDSCEVRIAKNCQSCGMPMNSPADFGGGDEENNYCVYCTYQDGTLKSFDEIYEGIISIYIKTRNMERTNAEEAARNYMRMMPAWARK